MQPPDHNDFRPGKSANASQPVSQAEAVAILTSCLALVRPVGMTEDETDDWLGAALPMVRHYRADTLHQAAAQAKRTIDHHSKIIPTIVGIADKIVPPTAWDDGWEGYELPKPRVALPAPALTAESIASLPAALVNVGLARGFLKRTADGSVIEA